MRATSRSSRGVYWRIVIETFLADCALIVFVVVGGGVAVVAVVVYICLLVLLFSKCPWWIETRLARSPPRAISLPLLTLTPSTAHSLLQREFQGEVSKLFVESRLAVATMASDWVVTLFPSQVVITQLLVPNNSGSVCFSWCCC